MIIPMQKIGMSSLKIEIITVSIEVKNRANASSMIEYLRKIEANDPAIRVIYNPGVEGRATVKVTSIPGIRVMHTEDIISQLETEAKIEVTPKNPERQAATEIEKQVVPATFLFCERLVPVSRKTIDKDGYESTVLAFGKGKLTSWNKAQHNLFECLGHAPKLICESRYNDLLSKYNIGDDINPCDLFRVGTKVDVTGTSIGHGFSGAMKRHNFSGMRATHGVSKSHRAHGSTGQRSQPGRVFKGKKMAGHYGNEKITVQSLKVIMSDRMNISGMHGSVIAVIGSVPGCDNGTCFIKPAVKGGI